MRECSKNSSFIRLKKQNSKYKPKTIIRFFLTIIVLINVLSCSSTRYVPDDKYLLNKNEVSINNKKNIDLDALKGYEKQRPNKTILGIKFHLGLYNLSNINKKGWPNNWLRKIGEEPVVYDKFETLATEEQFRKYLESKGYYHAIVTDTVKIKKRKADVTYNIKLNKPYIIHRINYFFEDTSLRPLIMADTSQSLIHPGQIFDKDILQRERIRIEDYLRNRGYYKFSKEYIYFDAVKLPDVYQIDLTLGIKKFTEVTQDSTNKPTEHRQYRINKVYIHPNFSSALMFSDTLTEQPPQDTLLYENMEFLYSGKLKIKPSVITQSDYILPGELYKLDNVNKTYQHLSSLGIYKLVNIEFNEPKNGKIDSLGRYPLNSDIELTRRKVQSFQLETLGTNSSGDLGARENFSYYNWNLFRGAEVFQVRLTGAIEAIRNPETNALSYMHETGVQASIKIPKFLLPLRTKGFVKKFNPKTTITSAYNYQDRPEYVRTIANATFGYLWRGNSYVTHNFSPFELNYVRLPFIDSTYYANYIEPNNFLKSSYINHLVGDMRYSFEYTNQDIEKKRDFIYLKVSLESAGDLLYAYSKLTDRKKSPVDNSYHYFGVPFFQYFKTDIDFRHYNVIDQGNKIVSRLFIGVGYPYGNSISLPFEKKYFAGGPNGIRAWSTRSLGPGSYSGDTVGYPNSMADMKLEGNVEYRFHLFWKLEGALFVDAGNIWSVRNEPTRPGAEFKWNTFYKDIAVGSGFGTRFDFSYLLIRFDFGIKLRDPGIQNGNKWIIANRPFKLSDFTVQFGLGYPF